MADAYGIETRVMSLVALGIIMGGAWLWTRKSVIGIHRTNTVNP